MKTLHYSLFIILCGIMGTLILLWLTPLGPGVSPDSTIYIIGAESIAAGNGFSMNGQQITLYPPLFSLLLAGMSYSGISVTATARIFNAILFGINSIIVGFLIYLISGRNFLNITCALLFYYSSAPFLLIHSWAWSEPLFIAFTLVCIILLSKYIRKPSTILFVSSALVLSLAMLTRYVGMGFLVTGAILIMIGGRGLSIGRRIRNSLSWLILAFFPLGVWLIRNYLLAGTATSRYPVFHPPSISGFFVDVISILANFFATKLLPIEIRLTILALLFITVFILLFLLLKYHWKEINWESWAVWIAISCTLFFISLILFIFISISTMDALTIIETRQLSPILVVMIVGLFAFFWVASKTLKNPIAWWCLLLFLFVTMTAKTIEAIQTAVDIQKNGEGYTSIQWQRSETLKFVRQIGDDVIIYSNGTDVISFITGKQSEDVPQKESPYSLVENTNLPEEVEILCDEVKENKAMVVYFDNLISSKWFLIKPKELELACQLKILQKFQDGFVYGG